MPCGHVLDTQDEMKFEEVCFKGSYAAPKRSLSHGRGGPSSPSAALCCPRQAERRATPPLACLLVLEMEFQPGRLLNLTTVRTKWEKKAQEEAGTESHSERNLPLPEPNYRQNGVYSSGSGLSKEDVLLVLSKK